MRVLLKGHVSPYSGYGSDTIALAKALLEWGAEVFLQPISIQGPVPVDVLMLLTKHLEAPFDLAIVHQDPAGLETTSQMKEASTLTVGWTMWEFENYFAESKISIDKRLSNFDVVAVYDEVTKSALEEFSETPMIIVQGGYEILDWQYMKRDWSSETFNFFMQGVLHERKGPWYSIEAFKELKEEFPEEMAGCQLHMKTTGGEGFHPKMEEWCPGLHVYNGIWPLKKLQDFYSKMHVLLAPSIGEGKNLPALQFLSSGGTVIATNWGGHTGWLSESYAYPLKYEMQVFNGLGRCAKPDKSHLKELMLHTVRNRNECYQKGALAARTIPHMCSWESVLERLFNQLAVTHPKGQALKSASVICRNSKDTEPFEERRKLMGAI